jgi:hypothetical protein
MSDETRGVLMQAPTELLSEIYRLSKQAKTAGACQRV